MSRGLLLDTHVWLWHASGDTRLTPALRRLIDRTDGLWFSPIAVWEIGLLLERGRIRLTTSLQDWVATRREERPMEEAALNAEVAVEALTISLPHRDPADRLLLATARVYDLTLITTDAHLIGHPNTRAR